MYIRVASVTFDPSRLDEALASVREAGLPGMRESPGVQSVYVGVERATGRATVVSTWDTFEHANFAVSPDFITRMQKLGMQGERPVIYEVTDQF